MFFPDIYLIPVHPHRRGEHIRKTGSEIWVTGSSPQAWGTWLIKCSTNWFLRFIPTGVGNILSLNFLFNPFSVHPHRRGEHLVNPLLFHFLAGSSPQAWGTFRCLVKYPFSFRFIPTGVGNMTPLSGKATFPPVHPHRRGEHCRQP